MGLVGLIKGPARRPRRVLLYGTHGIGKSTWAASAPNPIFLATEDGLDNIGVTRTPLIKDIGTFNKWLSDLLQQEHDLRTLVIDTADWLERLIHQEVATKANKHHIDDIAYGKGYQLAMPYWDFIVRTLDHLREQRSMAVIVLAHARIVKFAAPDSDTYDRYEPDLHKTVSPMLQEWADEVLFACYRVNTITREEGFNRERTRAVGSGERVVKTCEMPTHLASRRIPLPDEMPLDFSVYAKHVAAASVAQQPAEEKNIDGIVNNGHSKQKEPVNNG